MADISVQKKNADLTWVWAAAAIVAIAGLMVWLFMQDTGTTVVTTQPGDTVAEAPAPAEPAELSAIGAAPDQYVDRQVQVQNVPVTAPLGQRAFWADVPGASPVLVVVPTDVANAGWVQPDGQATVEGTVRPVTETEIDQWIQQGVLLAEARPQAAFATHYFRVSRVP